MGQQVGGRGDSSELHIFRKLGESEVTVILTENKLI